ncbi:MAG: hypothetical protein HC833_06865 [Leptolyngbyaceae cyanobacterium RM1_406_9]|nr:hypothetical protein [Leptolyngbyaceae cyanobacterium RM1_406_9]
MAPERSIPIVAERFEYGDGSDRRINFVECVGRSPRIMNVSRYISSDHSGDRFVEPFMPLRQ